MKNFLILFVSCFSAAVHAQDDVDAIRYSQSSFYGDSRFMSMGGAFGALGANLSCMNFNPAGIAVYRSGEFVFTPAVRVQSAKTVHYDSTASDFSTKLNISNIGFVTAWDAKNPYPSNSKLYENWNHRHAFGISYNRMNDFNFNTTISGSPNSSIINDFVNAAQGYTPSMLNGTYEWLAYQTYLINTEYDLGNSPNDSSHYEGFMLPGKQIQQNKKIVTSGRTGELAFAYAHAFEDKYYLGVTLGVPTVKYTRHSEYTENDYKNQVPYFKSLKYEENLVTSGTGVNLKIGGIYRVNEAVRIGAYAHTPSMINLSDNYEYKMTAAYDSNITAAGNVYTANYTGYFKYKLYTPARGGVSIAYVYKRLMAADLDLEYVGYGSTRLKDNNNYLDPINLTIQKKYQGTVNARAGVEFNLAPVVVRAGYAGYGSPFGAFTGKFARSSYSAGIGFKHKSSTFFDVGAVYTRWSEDYYLYDPSLVNASTVNNSVVYITFTLGVKFN